MLPAFGLYTHIQANRRRSACLIAGLFALFYLMTFGFALLMVTLGDDASTFDMLVEEAAQVALWLAPFVTVLVVLWVWCGLRFNTFILDLATGSSAITRADDPRLYNLLQNLCISRGMTMPKLRILETEAPNAYAAGVRPEQYTITLTRGLLDTLNEREIEAVLAHELTHIRNGDVRTMVIAVLVVGVMSFVGETLFRWLIRDPSSLRRSSHDSQTRSSGGGGGQLAALALALGFIAIAWLLSVVIRFSLSRKREYLADAGAVELTHNPDAMISALTKIAGKGELQNVPSAVMELCLDNPRSGFSDLFATHPSIEQRIDALVRYAGGRRPELPADTASGDAIPKPPTA